ncbi:hypothetical protein ACR777_10525 [Sphingobacterium spiritivorum]|uniref:hypothetical protein n=1 Tax=Sphingobacterium TaxID=28453 RepID=UPI0025FA6321|nr:MULTISPECIES: hypothetical protein [unclassified Sphingobacterium]
MTAQDKAYILNQLQELRSDISQCLVEVRSIKREIEDKPMKAKRRQNLTLNNTRLSRPIWENVFAEEYNMENLKFIKENIPVWIAKGYVQPFFLRLHYAENVPRNKRLRINLLITSIKQYRDFNGLEFRI